MAVGMMETAKQLLDMNTVISHTAPVQCCERLVHIATGHDLKYWESANIWGYTEQIGGLQLVTTTDGSSSSSSISSSTGWHKKRELLKNPTKIEEIQEKNLLTETEPLQLAF